YYLAALREAFEETGILVGERPDGSAPSTAVADAEVNAVREELMQDRIDFAQTLSALDCRVDGDRVEYIAHWITPTPEPRRYDTRFFAARVPPDTEAIVDPREMTEALWIPPSDALRRCDHGELPMVFPTIKTLEQLAEYEGADAALDGIGGEEVRTILPTLVVTPTGVGLEIDDA
ncbi:MAG: NUDIX hydrolase, partial [Gemmatimonadetes bacterium]|nr:NUDIX hydrolase [Gemmatimonadota bacterium]